VTLMMHIQSWEREMVRGIGYVPGQQVYTTRIIGRSSTSFTEREERERETTDSRGAPLEESGERG